MWKSRSAFLILRAPVRCWASRQRGACKRRNRCIKNWTKSRKERRIWICIAPCWKSFKCLHLMVGEQSIFVQTTERWAQLDSWARQIAAAALFSQLPLEQSADFVEFASWSKIKGSLSVRHRTPELRVSSSHFSYHRTRCTAFIRYSQTVLWARGHLALCEYFTRSWRSI
jgi:hypothetical protein